jgi:hypothetical protein
MIFDWIATLLDLARDDEKTSHCEARRAVVIHVNPMPFYSVLSIHDAQGYKSTKQIASELAIPKRSIIGCFILLMLQPFLDCFTTFAKTIFHSIQYYCHHEP